MITVYFAMAALVAIVAGLLACLVYHSSIQSESDYDRVD